MSRAASLVVLLAAALAAGSVPAQSGGVLRFTGSGVVGTPLELRVGGGTPAARMTVVLAPRVGSFQTGGFRTECFSVAGGLATVDLALDFLGGARLAFVLPPDPALVGAYLTGQGFELAPSLPVTGCASFLVIGDDPRPSLLETFDDGRRHDRALAAGRWAEHAGVVMPGPVGGSGQLGRFDHTAGTLRGSDPGGPWVFDTDAQAFPASQTLLGQPITVTDGVFEFTELVVPAGITVVFEGSKPARLLATGAVRIDGVLDVGAPPVALAAGAPGLGAGQPGGAGGPGGGAGGAGGDEPGATGGTGSPDGSAGEDLGLPGGDPAGVLATGGGGSPANPPAADPAAVRYGFLTFYSNQIAAGGGGGGHAGPGVAGRVLAERAPGGGGGPGGPGGVALARPAGSSRDVFLVTGSGGGGGGVHPYDSVAGQPVGWVRGSGGGGGGGGLLIACGGDFAIGPAGVIRADGGDAASRTDLDGLLLAPGGGGSGGSVLLQVGGAFVNAGEITARGGGGGTTSDLRAVPGASVAGGDGADGSIRIETRDGAAVPGRTTPVATSGVLADRDGAVAAASRWLRLPAGGDPAAMSYELYAVLDGRSVAYSDRAAFGSGPTLPGVTPVVLMTRFAQLDAAGQPVPGTEGAWAHGVAPAAPGADGVQFWIGFDRGAGASDLRVEALRLAF